MNTTRFIADAGSNHNGLISRALDLTLAAAEVGCDGV